MGSYNRDDRGGGRDFSPRGRSSFGGGRGGFRGGGFDRARSDRPMFKAICSNCGKECEVPFRPTGSKPVYCSECFEKRSRDAGHDNFSDRGPSRPSFENRGGGESQSRELSAISAKLDKIIALLTPTTPKQAEKTKGPESVELVEKVEEKPKKKSAKKSTSAKKE